MIIGINGKIGSGKDTVGKIIQYLVDYTSFNYSHPITEKDFQSYLKNEHYKNCSWEIKKFAGKLKEVVALITGCKVEDLENQDFKNAYLGKEWEYYNNGIPLKPMAITPEALKDLNPERLHCYNYRTLLQKIGTEAMRNVIHENVWVNALMSEYKDYHYVNAIANWIITDIRFPNEYKAVKDKGGICIRVNRVRYIGTHSEGEHESERVLDNYTFDYEINNLGTIEELIEQVKQILIKEKCI